MIVFWSLLVLTTLGSLTVAWRWRTWRLLSIAGPMRLGVSEPARLPSAALVVALGLWLVIPSLLRSQMGPASRPASQPAPLPDTQVIGLTLAMQLLPLAGLGVFYAIAGPANLLRLGLGVGDWRRTALWGFAGALLLIPQIIWLSMALERLYRYLEFEHPLKHALLLLFRNTHSPWVKLGVIVGATIGAPLFEELVFRGHVQTLLGRVFRVQWMSSRAASPTPVPDLSPRADAVIRWLAVIGASLLFTLVHEPWSWPAIFVLSLWLGYAYERTGSLYVPILMHMLFNGVSIVIAIAQP